MLARLWTLLLRRGGLKHGSPSPGSATSDVMTLGTASWSRPFSQDPVGAGEGITTEEDIFQESMSWPKLCSQEPGK